MSIGAARYTPGGDEHVFVELSEEMSLEAFFKGMAITTALERMKVPGVSEICPANASYQVRFDPDLTHPDAMVKILQRIEAEVGTAELELATRIVEIPVLFDDPWTNETQLRFRERHQDPSSTDLQYAARINGYASVADFVAAYCGSPWFVSMVGFVAGLPFMFQMVERARQIEVPKYLRPRTDSPQAHDRPRRLFQRHLFGAWRRRLPDVRHHAGTDLRSGPGPTVSERLHGVLSPGRHRQVPIDRSRRLRRGA